MPLYVAPTANFYSTTLNGSISSSQTTGITLNSVTNLQAPGYLVLDREDGSGNATPNAREVITFTGISGSVLTGVTRAADNSTARAHTDGALVEATVTVGLWNSLATIVDTAIDNNGLLRSMVSPVSAARLQITQMAVSSVASIARLEISQMAAASLASIAEGQLTRVYTSTATITARANIGQVAFSSTASVATSEFDIRNQDGHLDIRPGVSKLVKIAVLRQSDTTNAYKNSSVILTGYGIKVGTAAKRMSETVTFGIAFVAFPIVLAVINGASNGTDSPAGASDNADGNDMGVCAPMAVTASQFTAQMVQVDTNASWPNTRTYIYSWIAIGEV